MQNASTKIYFHKNEGSNSNTNKYRYYMCILKILKEWTTKWKEDKKDIQDIFIVDVKDKLGH